MSKIEHRFIENDYVAGEIPSGLINSSNVNYTLAFTPVYSQTLKLYLDGLYLVQGTDYTVSGANITMTTAPVFAQTLVAHYIKG